MPREHEREPTNSSGSSATLNVHRIVPKSMAAENTQIFQMDRQKNGGEGVPHTAIHSRLSSSADAMKIMGCADLYVFHYPRSSSTIPTVQWGRQWG